MKKLLLLLLPVLFFTSFIYSESYQVNLGYSINIDLPITMSIEKTMDFVDSYEGSHFHRQVFLCHYEGYQFMIRTISKIKKEIRSTEIADEYEIPILRANVGLGYEHYWRKVVIENDPRLKVKYVFGNGERFGRNDLAIFYIILNYHKYFSSILITVDNIWIDKEDPLIRELDTSAVNIEIHNGNTNADIYRILKESIQNFNLDNK